MGTFTLIVLYTYTAHIKILDIKLCACDVTLNESTILCNILICAVYFHSSPVQPK